MSDRWLAIVQGNTHHRWGRFVGDRLQEVEVYAASQAPEFPPGTEIWCATVGSAPPIPPLQVEVHLIALAQIPLGHLYPTLGIDRALAVLAAGQRVGWPVLAIDAGTALTFTGADEQRNLVGGAILPGLALQARSLHDHTATLPHIDWHHTEHERYGHQPRWARDTVGAIQSGIWHTVIAGLISFCVDWLQLFPSSSIVITGGDGELLYDELNRNPGFRYSIRLEPDLVLLGIADQRRVLQQKT